MPEADSRDAVTRVECLLSTKSWGFPPGQLLTALGRKRGRQKDWKFKILFIYQGTSRLDQDT